jgi:hypothetical protein
MFGGTMSIEEFRKVGTGDVKVIVHKPDDTFHIQVIHNCTCGGNIVDPLKRKSMQEAMGVSTETVTSTTDRLHEEKLHMINNSSGRNEPLRLKRPKPLKRDQNNLEKTLGIIRTSKK